MRSDNISRWRFLLIAFVVFLFIGVIPVSRLLFKHGYQHLLHAGAYAISFCSKIRESELGFRLLCEKIDDSVLLWASNMGGKKPVLLSPQCCGHYTMALLVAVMWATPKGNHYRKFHLCLFFSIAFFCWSLLRVLFVLELYYSGVPWGMSHHIIGIGLDCVGVFVAIRWIMLRMPEVPHAIISLVALMPKQEMATSEN